MRREDIINLQFFLQSSLSLNKHQVISLEFNPFNLFGTKDSCSKAPTSSTDIKIVEKVSSSSPHSELSGS